MEQLADSIVVVADTLGTRDSTTTDAGAREFLAKLLRAASRVSPRLGFANRRTDAIHYRWFSDSFQIGTSMLGAQSLHRLLEVTAQVQLEFLLQGLFLRGAMARGLWFHSENIDYGPALVEGVDAERALARMPRIVLTQRVRNDLLLAVSAARRLIAVDDTDDTAFIDFLSLLAPDARRDARRRIQEAQAEAPASTADKFLWLSDYYDFATSGTKKIGPRKYRFSALP